MRRGLVALLLALGLGGCSSVIANVVSGSGGSFGSDDDPELIAAASPFGLKTMESVLQSEPEHVGLLTALARGFTQYGYAFVDLPAQALAEDDLDAGLAGRVRARRLYQRALRYALRGLEVEHEGFEARLRADPSAALKEIEDEEEVELLYWTAASWGLAISASKNEPSVFSDLPIVVAVAERALEIDEDFNAGALHDLAVTLETARPGGDVKAARAHFERALELNGGTRVGTYVSFAEGVCVKEQDARSFHVLLGKALAIDLDAAPSDRLVNTIMRRKAARLKAASEDLFLEDWSPETETETSSVAGAAE